MSFYRGIKGYFKERLRVRGCSSFDTSLEDFEVYMFSTSFIPTKLCYPRFWFLIKNKTNNISGPMTPWYLHLYFYNSEVDLPCLNKIGPFAEAGTGCPTILPGKSKLVSVKLKTTKLEGSYKLRFILDECVFYPGRVSCNPKVLADFLSEVYDWVDLKTFSTFVSVFK